MFQERSSCIVRRARARVKIEEDGSNDGDEEDKPPDLETKPTGSVRYG
jgi:hypothetical protein